MRFFYLSLMVALGLLVRPASAVAQLDPSSALLLNGGDRPTSRESGVDSGRYTVKPKTDGPSRREDSRPVSSSTQRRAQQDPAPATESTPEAPEKQAPASANAETAEPIYLAIPTQGPQTPEARPPRAPARRQLNQHSSMLELGVAPGFVYTNSDSPYYFRRYHASAPMVAADARVWFNPGLALQTTYTTTLSGHVSDALDGSKATPVTQQWVTAGFRSRKLYQEDDLVSSLQLGLDYYEYQFRVPSDSDLRAKLSSSGVQLSIESEFAANASRSWMVGFTFSPKLKHKEDSMGTEFRSGGNVDANGVGASFGGRVRFDRSDSVFWRISHSIEKDLFSGQATAADPLTGATPTGVAVGTSFSTFQFGYTWGN